MQMKTLTALALMTMTLIGCRSSKEAAEPAPGASKGGPVCICGTAEAAIHTCVHPACLGGHSNPDNPDCACGTLEISGE